MKKSFEELFGTAFEEGLADIKFFVRPGLDLDADRLMGEAIRFEEAIRSGRTTQVEAVD